MPGNGVKRLGYLKQYDYESRRHRKNFQRDGKQTGKLYSFAEGIVENNKKELKNDTENNRLPLSKEGYEDL